MAVWRLQVNTGGTNVADYCLKNHVAAMGWSLRELTQAERSGIHTFLDYCNLARTQYKSFDSVCRMVEDVKEGDLLWMRSRNEGKYYIARVKANSTWVFREDAVQIDAAKIPVASEVQGVCGMLGLEPLYLACEGRLVIMAPKEQAQTIVDALKVCPYSQDAAIIGEVTEEQPGKVVMLTEIGTQALLPQPGGELLPRIC